MRTLPFLNMFRLRFQDLDIEAVALESELLGRDIDGLLLGTPIEFIDHIDTPKREMFELTSLLPLPGLPVGAA